MKNSQNYWASICQGDCEVFQSSFSHVIVNGSELLVTSKAFEKYFVSLTLLRSFTKISILIFVASKTSHKNGKFLPVAILRKHLLMTLDSKNFKLHILTYTILRY